MNKELCRGSAMHDARRTHIGIVGFSSIPTPTSSLSTTQTSTPNRPTRSCPWSCVRGQRNEAKGCTKAGTAL